MDHAKTTRRENRKCSLNTVERFTIAPMTTDARDIAVDTLAATKAVIDHLDGLHDQLHAERDGRGYVAVETVLARKVGECRDTIRFGLKFAEINALVAISDRLTELVVIASEKTVGVVQ